MTDPINTPLDTSALNAAAAKLRKLRLTDVGGGKEHPCETVKSALKRGLGGLYDDEAIAYILRHGIHYYQRAINAQREEDQETDHVHDR